MSFVSMLFYNVIRDSGKFLHVSVKFSDISCRQSKEAWVYSQNKGRKSTAKAKVPNLNQAKQSHIALKHGNGNAN